MVLERIYGPYALLGHARWPQICASFGIEGSGSKEWTVAVRPAAAVAHAFGSCDAQRSELQLGHQRLPEGLALADGPGAAIRDAAGED